MKPAEYELAVVGGGIAALTAAWHAALDGSRVILLAGADLPGGLVANIGAPDGFPSSVPTSGMVLAERMHEQASALGVDTVRENIDSLSVDGARLILRSSSREWRAAQVIGATGARLKPLDVPGAMEFRDKGVLQCAWCNAGLFRGRHVAVVGAGDAAFQEAAHLAKLGVKVTLIVRGEQVRARRALIEQASANESVAFLWSTEVNAVIGKDFVTGVELRDLQTGVRSTIACDAVFPYVGLQPNSEWMNDLVDRAPSGAVVTDARFRTRTPGVFAVGALRHGYGGRLTHALGEATSAAIEVSAELENQR